MQRILIFGNSGAGKSTLARQLATERGLAHLDLDTLAWQPGSPPQRRPLKESARDVRARPWEPHKYASKAEQDANLPLLLDWVRDYETRDDEFSLRSHRRLYDNFAGLKRELHGEALSGP